MTQIVSSISGIEIYAPSAGYAPLDSASVSAIASGYQVVSATGTQLYAGTAHVTSINSTPISASRAGNAANASMANSAYYDGTGRLISALPDAAEVSAIASAYADDKLDKTAEVVTATAGDGTYVTSINGMEISGQGGGGAQVVTATGSASATSLSGLWIATSYLVSSINGSAILPYGYDILSSNTAKWTSTTYTLSSNSANWTGTNSAVSANSAKWTSTNSAVSANSAGWTSTNSAVSANSAKWTSTNSAVSANSANWNSVYNTVSSNSASWSGSTAGSVTSPSGTIMVMNGNEIEATNSAVVTASGTGFEELLSPQTQQIGTYIQTLTYGTVPGTGATLSIPLDNPAWADIPVILSGRDTGYGYASASGIITSGVLTASIPMDGIVSNISASASNWINLAGEQLTAKKDGDILVTGIGELAWASSVSGVVNTVSSNSATWGQGGIDSATVSAIASSYVESGVSSKADSSALSSYALSSDVSGVIDTVSANSATWGGGATGDYVEKSALEVTIGSANNAVDTAFAQGSGNSAYIVSFAQGNSNNADNGSFAQGLRNSAIEGSFAQGAFSIAMNYSFAQGERNSASSYSFAQGSYNSAINTVAAFGEFNLHGDGDTSTGDSAAFVIGNGDGPGFRHDLMLVTKDGEITMYSSTADTTGTGIMSSIRAVSAGVSSKADSSALSSYALSADVSGTVDLVSSQSANWGGSALQLSAGAGISLTLSGNVLVIATAGV